MTTATMVTDRHDHLPLPTYEWVLESSCETVVPHLKMVATQVTWEGQHFHVCEIAKANDGEPELFQIELSDRPVGAVNFLPLPDNRTLMRLYICTDLGAVCTTENGNAIISGFVMALMARLKQLGFVAKTMEQSVSRPLGFHVPQVAGS